MIESVLEAMQRRLATAVVVGLLTFGAPPIRPLPNAPPAVVRVQIGSSAAEAWRELFPYRPAPN